MKNKIEKITDRIDYNNEYTIKRALNSLVADFNFALKRKNLQFARLIIEKIEKIKNEYQKNNTNLSINRYFLEKNIDILVYSLKKQIKIKWIIVIL